MRGKRGWTRILEATIAVMLVAGVMLVSYSGQIERDLSVAEYSQSWQREILNDIVSRSDLRLNVLNVVTNSLDDSNYVILNDFVMSKVPSAFGYLLRICELGSLDDYCKMDSINYIATLENNVFVEEVIVSAEVGNGTGEEKYSPKRVRLFFWEGGFAEDSCKSVCAVDGFTKDVCSGSNVTRKTCGYYEDDPCLKYDDGFFVKNCGSQACSDGKCVPAEAGYNEISCERKVDFISGCGNMWAICADYDKKDFQGDCKCNRWGHNCKDLYECWNVDDWESECVEDPVCPAGYDKVSSAPCSLVKPCENKCTDDSYYCSSEDDDVMVNVCEDSNNDGCLTYSPAVLFKDCAADEVCSGKYCLAKGVDCNDECINYSNDCSEDKTKIFKKTCGDYDDDDCLEYSEVSFEYCGSGEECSDGVCICYDECVNDEVSCSDDSTVRTRICRDNNNDGCKEYTGTILVTCDAGKVCDDGACVVDSSGVASLSLGFSGVSYVWQSPQHYYYHTRTFSESNGVGVTLTSGQLCFQSTGECNSAAVNYRIEAGGSLVRSGENFATPTTPDQFTLKYSGTDDNGNSINIQEVVSVSGSSWLSP